MGLSKWRKRNHVVSIADCKSAIQQTTSLRYAAEPRQEIQAPKAANVKPTRAFEFGLATDHRRCEEWQLPLVSRQSPVAAMGTYVMSTVIAGIRENEVNGAKGGGDRAFTLIEL